jgi:hypothetical protein
MVGIEADFSDVDKFFTDGLAEVRDAVDRVGDEADEYDREHGDYKDHTGTLRRNNRHEVGTDGSLTLINDARNGKGEGYASYVEAKGYQVRSGGALYAERRLKEIFGQ